MGHRIVQKNLFRPLKITLIPTINTELPGTDTYYGTHTLPRECFKCCTFFRSIDTAK